MGREKADTLTRLSEIQGDLLLIFVTLDPHVPEDGRMTIKQALEKAKVRHTIRKYEANHTFMRDDDYRFDPVATDHAMQEIISFLQSTFNNYID